MVKVSLRPWSLLKPNRVYDVTIQFSFSGNHADLFFVCKLIWIILYLNFADTVSPTAYITTSTPFTNALNVSINISFSEPCIGPTGGGGFVCSSVNDCNVSRWLTNTLNWFYVLYSILHYYSVSELWFLGWFVLNLSIYWRIALVDLRKIKWSSL